MDQFILNDSGSILSNKAMTRFILYVWAYNLTFFTLDST